MVCHMAVLSLSFLTYKMGVVILFISFMELTE